jgi:hypothetical protein
MWLNSSLLLDQKRHPSKELRNTLRAPLGYLAYMLYALSSLLSCQPRRPSFGMPSISASITVHLWCDPSPLLTLSVKRLSAMAFAKLDRMRLTRQKILGLMSPSSRDWYSGAWLARNNVRPALTDNALPMELITGRQEEYKAVHD